MQKGRLAGLDEGQTWGDAITCSLKMICSVLNSLGGVLGQATEFPTWAYTFPECWVVLEELGKLLDKYLACLQVEW